MNAAWPRVPLREVLVQRCEVPDPESLALGNIRIVSKIRFDIGKIELRQEVGTKTGMILVHPGDLLLSGINAAKGAIAIYGADNAEPVAATIHYGAYEVVENRDITYLWWYLRSKPFREILFESLPDGIKTELKASRLLPIEIPLPPLAEQRRIVARIQELADQIGEAKSLRKRVEEETRALVASRISELFTEGPRHGWESGVLGDYVTNDCYGTSEKTSDDDSGTPILRMGNIQNGQLDFHDLKYLHLSEKERNRLTLQSGDILVNRTNSAELVGKCAVFEFDGEFSFASYLIRLRLDLKRAEPRLVAAYINSPIGRRFMLTEKKQMTGQANVNSTKLKALPIVLPPLPEQRRIVTELDALQAEVDALTRLQAETSAELDALLPSILDRAFKGEL